MIVPYRYISWTEPRLTDAEELSIGQKIHEVGKERFLEEFRASLREIDRPKSEPSKLRPSDWLWLIVIGIAGVWVFAFTSRGPRLFLIVLLATFLVTCVYVGSGLIARWRHKRWIVRLERKYLHHLAQRNGQ